MSADLTLALVDESVAKPPQLTIRGFRGHESRLFCDRPGIEREPEVHGDGDVAPQQPMFGEVHHWLAIHRLFVERSNPRNRRDRPCTDTAHANIQLEIQRVQVTPDVDRSGGKNVVIRDDEWRGERL